ncbi:hypothetical protein BaRGS_00007609 [Batillaria attramentaria]|uniref:Ras-related protein Rab-3 n=1 Tax=Batillaria attramentaria TaxID=370345 RepID=A0ABD0LNB9_9CAEN
MRLMLQTKRVVEGDFHDGGGLLLFGQALFMCLRGELDPMGGKSINLGVFAGAPDETMASATNDSKWQKDAADQNFDYMFKLLIIGNSSVGKTSFLFRYADDSFTSAFVSTVGIDFKVKTVFRQDKRVKLQIWDTAGQERYRTITTAYYRGAMGFILMYDVTNEESFNAVQDWCTQIKTHAWSNASVVLVGNKCDLEDSRVVSQAKGQDLASDLGMPLKMLPRPRLRTVPWCTQIKTYSWDNAQVVLVGNKCDLEDERVVSAERGKQLADQLGLEFFETSAKENINVKAVFERLVDIICDKMSESLDSDPTLVSNTTKATRLTENPNMQSNSCGC